MKFRISQEEISKTLLAVNKSLLAKVNLPILANILVSATKEKIEVLSTDLETATRVVVSCKVEKEGKVALPGRTLLEFVSQLPEGGVVFEKLDQEVLVATKNYSARLATMPAEDFPVIPKIEKGGTIMLAPRDFMKAIMKVAFCAAQEEGRPTLTGVLCEAQKTHLLLVATDGYRLGFQRVSIVGGDPVSLKAVIPAKALIEVAKLISERAEELEGKSIKLVIADNFSQVNFKIGNIEFSARVIEGEFPSWQKIIPTTFTTKVKVAKEEFIKLVRIASIFARESGNIIRLKLEGGEKGKAAALKVFAINNQVGSNEAETRVELSGEGGEIAFNFRYLLETLSSIEGEDVNFEMIESLNPGRFTETDGRGDFFHIIMPVRLQS